MKKTNFFTLIGICVTGLYFANMFTKKNANLAKLDIGVTSYEYKWKHGVIYYAKHGTGSPLLLIHDITSGSSSFEWNELSQYLSKNHTVYALDLIGCGRSDKSLTTYTNFVFVQLISDFIENVIGESCDVVTSGSSSAIGLMSETYNKTIIDKLIMINPASLSPTPLAENAAIITNLYNCPIIGTFLANKKNTRDTFAGLFYKKYFYDASRVSPSYIDNYFSSYHYGKFNSKSIYASILTNYTSVDCTNALSDLENSVYVITGDEFDNVSEIIEEYETLKPSIEFQSIPKTKALPQLEEPELLSNIILSIIDK